jgi:hypothetical protein
MCLLLTIVLQYRLLHMHSTLRQGVKPWNGSNPGTNLQKAVLSVLQKAGKDGSSTAV